MKAKGDGRKNLQKKRKEREKGWRPSGSVIEEEFMN